MIRFGVICPSEIALRRFMPALRKIEGVEFAGIGVCTAKERFKENFLDASAVEAACRNDYLKAETFTKLYGGRIFEGYQTIAESEDIDALYIPLPPALHFTWAKTALLAGKHVFVEKPATLSAKDTKSLVETAISRDCALHENYMFVYHRQIAAIREIVESGELGDVRLYRIAFGFPKRPADDFRYKRELGGGALIDAGGYAIKYAVNLLGDSARIRYAQMNYTDDYEVDLYGSAALSNEHGETVQISYGMDNNYKCELEVWGSKGALVSGRVLTAPDGFIPTAVIRKGNEDEIRSLPADDAFRKSIETFLNGIRDHGIRKKNYENIVKQAEYVEKFKEKAEENEKNNNNRRQ